MSKSTHVKETNDNAVDSDEYIFLPPAQARKALRVAASTLRLWDKSGKQLHTERMPSGYRFYRIPFHMLDSSTRKQFGAAATKQQPYTKFVGGSSSGGNAKLKYIYARVSTPKQKKTGDFQRQIEAMQKEYPDHQVLTDVASGINWKRPALKTLLELASKGMVEEIVVAHRDRHLNTSSACIKQRSLWATHQQRTPILSKPNLRNSHRTSWPLTQFSSASNNQNALQRIEEKEKNKQKLNRKEKKLLKTVNTKAVKASNKRTTTLNHQERRAIANQKKKQQKQNTFLQPETFASPSLNPNYQVPNWEQDPEHSFLYRTITRKNQKRKMKVQGNNATIRTKKKFKSKEEEQVYKAQRANEVSRTFRVRLYFNKQQKQVLHHWMDGARYFYNLIVENYRALVVTKDQNSQWAASLLDLNAFRRLRNIRKLQSEYEWYNQIPYDIADGAVSQAIRARDEVVSRNLEGYNGVHSHTLKFKSAKQMQQTILIREQYCREGIKFYINNLHRDLNAQIQGHHRRLKAASSSRLYPGHPEHRSSRNNHWPNPQGMVQCDSSLTFRRHTNTYTFNWCYRKPRIDATTANHRREKYGQAKLSESSITSQTTNFNTKLKIRDENHVEGGESQASPVHFSTTDSSGEPSGDYTSHQLARTIALDPGIRTFQTYITGTGIMGKIGDGDMQRIGRLCYFMDKLQSRRSQLHGHGTGVASTRRRYKFALARMRRKIKHLVQDVHTQTVQWLVTNFDTIIVPDFDAGALSETKRRQRKLRSETVRKMLIWSHGSFRDRLVNKLAEFHPSCNKQLFMPSEAHSSKTCSGCGHVDKKLGGNETFHCAFWRGGCGLIIDRDVNGARGIFLRALVDLPILSSWKRMHLLRNNDTNN